MTTLRDNQVHPVAATGLLLLASILAACFSRNAPTAPSVDAMALSTAGFIGDRPYTWSLKCSGKFASQASWSWSTGGVTITGTETSVFCSSALAGTGTRPASADGFRACVNYTCDSWPLDPATAFKTHLTGSYTTFDFTDPTCYLDPFGHTPGRCFTKVSATLTVDS
jgi:hypothetical protein